MPEENEIDDYDSIYSYRRIHFRDSLNSAGTQTGRVSSIIPNISNIPQEANSILDERTTQTVNLVARWASVARDQLDAGSYPMQMPESPIYYIKWNYPKRRRIYSWFRNKWWNFRCSIGEFFQFSNIKFRKLKTKLNKEYLYYSCIIKQYFKYKVKTKEEFF